MGSSKFFFSGMIQNYWLYKLKYMSKTKSQKSTKTRNQLNTKSAPPPATHAPPQPHHLCQQRKSYHFTRDLNTPHPPSPNYTNSAPQLPNTPTKSSKKRQSIKKQRMPSYRASSISTDTSFRISVESGSMWTKPDSTADDYPHYHHSSFSEDDNNSIFPCIISKNGDFNLIPQVELPTIVTKKTTKSNKNDEARKNINSPIRKVTVKLRTNSPRLLASKRFAQVNGRKSVSMSGGKRRSLSESVAVIKLSQDPYKDFKESMVEMIMVNNMRTSKDLEDLLACYLSLNSDKYHDVIIKVFKQIWLETINNIKFFK